MPAHMAENNRNSTAKVNEIVRCKDCVHYRKEYGECAKLSVLIR